MTLDTLEKPLKSSAPGQYLGFGVQPVRFCYHLLRLPDGDSVSLENLDDVAIHHADGSFILEQCKSSISGKVLGDKSIDLWKTFGNWADICTTQKIDPSIGKFVLYLTPGTPGQFANELHSAATDDAAKPLLEKMKKWQATAVSEKGFGPHLARFLALGDEKCALVIRNFELVVEPDPLEGVKQLLRATLPETAIAEFCPAAIGQAKEWAERLMRDQLPAVVECADFRKKFRAFVRKYNLAGLLNPTTGVPDPAKIAATIASAPTYVRQLHAIDLNPELIVGAVSACLRTMADKIKWAADGLIVNDSLAEFDNSLQSRFVLIRDEVEDLSSTAEEKIRGRAVYRRCSMTQLPLEGRALPNHFVEGAFNVLADDVRVGWHPLYQDLFGEK